MFPTDTFIITYILTLCDPKTTPKHLILVCKSWSSILANYSVWQHWLRAAFCDDDDAYTALTRRTTDSVDHAERISFRELVVTYVINNNALSAPHEFHLAFVPNEKEAKKYASFRECITMPIKYDYKVEILCRGQNTQHIRIYADATNMTQVINYYGNGSITTTNNKRDRKVFEVPEWKKGDVISCEIEFADLEVTVTLLHNWSLVYRAKVPVQMIVFSIIRNSSWLLLQ